MFILNFFLKYQIFFRCYLAIIFFLNLYIFYTFIINQIIKSIIIGNNKNIIKKYDMNETTFIDDKYFHMLKKIKKITNNPIIYEYQLTQIHKIDINSNKYIQYHKELNKINKHNEQYIKSHKYFIKILLTNNFIIQKNKDINIDILAKLLCINF